MTASPKGVRVRRGGLPVSASASLAPPCLAPPPPRTRLGWRVLGLALFLAMALVISVQYAAYQGLKLLEAEHGVAIRFVIGRSENSTLNVAVAAEARRFGDIMRVPTVENYYNLVYKTMAFFRAALDEFDADYIMKSDDDVYIRLDRFPLAVRQWAAEGAGYVGCVHMGNTAETTDVWDDWYNPVAMLAANHRQFAYMRGGFYGLRASAAAMLAAHNDDAVRATCCEDITVGLTMIALNAPPADDQRLCHTTCQAHSIVVWPNSCHGACEDEQLLLAHHHSPACRAGGLADIGPLRGQHNPTALELRVKKVAEAEAKQ